MTSVETFHVAYMSECPRCGTDPAGMGQAERYRHQTEHIGWYWRRPGSVFEDARGPFATEEKAAADAAKEEQP